MKPSIAPRSNIAPSPTSIASPPIIKTSTPPGGISMSKEWVLPPRPKPGRKPSVDTPASKRKAQNRAAQRAFRERRATRVQELEQKLMEIEKEKDVKEMALINTINKLKVENQFLLKNVDQLKNEVNFLRKNQNSGHMTTTQTRNSSMGSPMALNSNSPASSVYSVQQISPAPSADSPPKKDDFDCGICLKDECLCEDVGIKEKSLQSKISSFKPMQAVSLKRKAPVEEVDFTKSFTKKPLPDFKKVKSLPRFNKIEPEHVNIPSNNHEKFDEGSPVDNCGFCSDDTPCVCREAAKEAALLSQKLNDEQKFDDHKTELPPIQSTNVRKVSLPVMHPGPSVEIREISNLTPGAVPTVTTPTTRNTESPSKSFDCTGNPGTCRQCQMDPMSTLFCTTVANKGKDEDSNSSGSSKVSTPAPIIEEESNQLPPVQEISSSVSSTSLSSTDMFIPCADAYKTLSRHKKFNSVDFSTLVGKLTTRGMQVEVQSVANVLRELDRRLYN
ncbi:putative bZIP transcription factor Hapxp [[Candida] jaroonii]|uniref:BZIP transcription factor Hapxp n=1 Tax=[Candida] jaroonii TaxID=467808 RepID=A0ACA9YAY7_9ASCO|nr:putative bZIP transcription factor Hapxp [[Candida] jaroonii]